MTAIHETAYPRLKPNLSQQELNEIFTPTAEELNLLNQKTKRTSYELRLGFMLLLKCYQCLGRSVKFQKIEPAIKKHIAIQIGIDSDLDLSRYTKLVKHRHLKIVREYLKINFDRKECRKIMKVAALRAADTKENLADIMNVVIEELVRFRYEFPSFRKLERLSRAARVVVNNNNYFAIYNKLTDKQRKLIDCILGDKESEDKNKYLSWAELKQEPRKPTLKQVRTFTEHVNKLKSICKSEEFNEFISWVRFGDGGTIKDNLRFNQGKIIKFSHMLCNMLIFHTVAHQTKGINKLLASGMDIPNEILSGFSPYWQDHINRFGAFPLEMKKKMEKIEYRLCNTSVSK